jgi:phage/plasmid-associated DNA primase
MDNKKFSNGKTKEEIQKQYVRQSDSVKAFSTEMLEYDPSMKISEDMMYIHYKSYCEVHKLEPEISGRFKGLLKCFGYTNERTTYKGSERDYYWTSVDIKN